MPPAPHSPFDPLARLDPGEDRFVIREKDQVGPEAITAWAHLRRNWAIKTYGTEPLGDAARLLKAEFAQCAEAEEKALAWRERQQGAETPDEQRASYANAVQSEEQIAAAKRQKMQAELRSLLREADYYAAELLALDGPTASPDLAEKAAALHEMACGPDFAAREAA